MLRVAMCDIALADPSDPPEYWGLPPPVCDPFQGSEQGLCVEENSQIELAVTPHVARLGERVRFDVTRSGYNGGFGLLRDPNTGKWFLRFSSSDGARFTDGDCGLGDGDTPPSTSAAEFTCEFTLSPNANPGWKPPDRWGTVRFDTAADAGVEDDYFGIRPGPSAAFTWLARDAEPLTVDFDASASVDDQGIVEYAWDFGDGNVGNGVTTEHTYAATGDYVVTLTVTDSDDLIDDEVVAIFVAGEPGPVAFFTWQPRDDDLLTVDFDGSGSRSPNGDIVSWEWDFGDGTSATGDVVEHTFPARGVYEVRLEVADDDSPVGTAERTRAIDVDTLDVDWKMAPRFGLDEDHDGLVDYVPDGVNPEPDHFDVELLATRFDGSPCDPNRSYRWSRDGEEIPVVKDGCTFAAQFDDEGTYEVSVELDDHLNGRRDVIVQDWLIVSVGDSIASGEGNPDLSVLATGGDPAWQLERCHRSALAGPARAAREIEESDERTSVTFVHLACSGATVFKGLVGPYFGIAPGDATVALPSQLAQIEPLVGDREIDAMFVSIGANDVGFGPIAKFCALSEDCPQQGFNDTHHVLLGGGLIEAPMPIPVADPGFPLLHAVLDHRLARLPENYDALAERLTPIVAADRVYFTEYMDPTRDQSSAFCDPMLDIVAELEQELERPVSGFFDLDLPEAPTGIFAAEAEWAYDGAGLGRGIVTGLNDALGELPTKHGWHLVTGIDEGWTAHGYCSTAAWVQTMERSKTLQANHDGTLHPNADGHAFTGTRIAEEVKKALYDDEGLPRPPQEAALRAAGGPLAVTPPFDTLAVELDEIAIDNSVQTATLAGSVAVDEDSGISCGEDVVLTLGASSFADTLDGGAFQETGSTCRYEAAGPGVTSFELDVSNRSWRAALAAVDLTALANPIDVVLQIGDNVGRDDVIAAELPTGWVLDPDATAPELTLVGPNPQVVLVGAQYEELGATALDDVDGDLSDAIEIDASAVETSLVGSYAVAYRVTDSAGNARIALRGVDVATATTLPATTTTTVPAGGACGDPIAFVAHRETATRQHSGQAVSVGAAESRFITASDALVVLRTAVGSASCGLCVCDVNDSGNITASDALIVLRRAVGQVVELTCPPCS